MATPKTWSCELCQKKCGSKNLLDDHMNIHSGRRPFKCDMCPKDFTSKYILATHLKTHQERERVFNCQECGKGFYTQQLLERHERRHTATRDYICQDCGKGFMLQHNLNQHRIVHSNHKPFACRTCGKCYARKVEVTAHERTHTGERPFVCDICDATFARRSTLRCHIRFTHTDEKHHKCDLCDRSFKRRRLLDYHTKARHTGERPYKCDICSATFVYPDPFKKHKKIHAGSKPFACEFCTKSFTNRENRNTHRFIHSDKKLYECVTCGADYMRKSRLYNHMQLKGHLNDTIVINQPLITKEDMLEFNTTAESISELDAEDDEEEDIDTTVEMLGETAVVLDDMHHQIEETIHYCYVCNSAISNSTNNLCQLFPIVSEEDEIVSPANILANILQIDITPELSHSQVICIDCDILCNEYQQLLDRLDSIKLQMTVSYNSTVTKLAASLTAKELVDAEAEALDDSSISQDLDLHDTSTEIMAIPIDELTSVVSGPSTVDMDSDIESATHAVVHQIPSLHLMKHSIKSNQDQSLKSNSRSIIKIIQKTLPNSTVTSSGSLKQEAVDTCEVPSAAISMEQFFDGSDGNMVEIITDGNSTDYIYENVIETIGGSDEANPSGSDEALTLDSGSSAGIQHHHDNLVGDVELAFTEQAFGQEADPDSAQILIAAANESLNRIKSKLESLFFKSNDNYYCALCKAVGAPNTAHNVKTIALHLKTDHDEKILICEHCDAVFWRRTEYNEHLDQHVASELTDFRCDICSTKFNNIRTLRMHRKNHVATPKVWSCEVCQKKYSSKNLLDDHMNMHSGRRPFKCDMCPKDFASKYTLAAHLKTHQERERVFSCKECGKGFYSQNNLIQHEKIHTGVRDYVCPDCGKTFMSQHNLDIHKIVHLNYKPFVCRTCGKGFARKAEIKDHERTHTGERPFVCDICDASFSQRSNLQSHKRATHFDDKRYKCDICNRCFKRRRLLDYHIKACHTGERPYKCDICSATFIYPEHFKKHQKIHTGTKPFACEVCAKTFNSRDNRNAHRFVHSDKKPYECVTCGAGFMRKPQLYSHMLLRGHLNDTIVINQPRITNEDMLEFDTTTDSIGELDPKDGIIVRDDGHDEDDILSTDEYYVKEEHDEVEEANGEVIPGTSQTQLQLGNAVELSESTALLASTDDFIDSSDIINGDDGLQLVKLKITNPNDKNSITWVNFVPQ
ncbi:zinc finger protein 845-like [Toxorhynchites rutilus septentrionalis]|uniref:zinc finger protein 845-like n=1 Tax=Toxorhynchites rutilus septentrionalis TaxID=329112 RepID=UPI00247ABEAC|nr:zinc finger protein 845-like [Toxorhynchites rutilus septentrionalis]